MKVWGTNLFRGGAQRRWIVAAPTQKRAAELFGVRVRELRTYGCVTGNAAEIKYALAKPETVLLACAAELEEER